MIKTCFVLGAGGARGIAHIGFLQAMDENGIKPDFIAGCSMGSVIGGCYASGMKPADMLKIVDTMKMSQLADASIFPFNKKSILKSAKLRKRLEELLGDKTFSDLQIPFECIAGDIVTGEVVVLKTGSVAEAVRASSSIPAVFRPVEMGNRVLVDGGIFMPLPLTCVKDFNADAVIVVDVLGPLPDYQKNKGLLNHVLRTVDANSAYLRRRQLKSYRHDLLICPELGNMSQFKVENLRFAYEQGYKAGLENAQKIKEIIEKKRASKIRSSNR
ncbi:MAG: patatin-like phospholipase family protein [Clostridia bacterium]|nr:patatin-like phospholipase family protein [Clostridia bacterium]